MGKFIFIAFFILYIFGISPSVYADASSTEVSSLVSPVRYVIVSNDEKITEIYSNTNQSIKPIFLQNNTNGLQLSPSASLEQDYNKLSKSINYHNYGKVYEAKKEASLFEPNLINYSVKYLSLIVYFFNKNNILLAYS